MFDPTSIGAALGSAKTILDLLKTANDAQLAIKISTEVANVQGKLVEVQQQILAIQQENQELRSEVNKYKNYRHHHSAIWRHRHDGTEEGPFCPTCNGEGSDIRLILRSGYDQTKDVFHLECPNTHVDPKAKPQGFAGPKMEAFYQIPKALVPADYFYIPPVRHKP